MRDVWIQSYQNLDKYSIQIRMPGIPGRKIEEAVDILRGYVG